MLYFLESQLPNNKLIFFSLQSIFGIGYFNSFLICKQLGFSKNFKTKNLSQEQINKILKILESLSFKLTTELKQQQILNLKKLILIKSYRGLRRLKGLPVRGQRTRTNSKTSKNLVKSNLLKIWVVLIDSKKSKIKKITQIKLILFYWIKNNWNI